MAIGRAGVVQTLPISVNVAENGFASNMKVNLAPNPFSESIGLRINLENPSLVSILIRNLNGAVIKTISAEEMSVGYHEFLWDGKNDTGQAVPQGIYLAEVEVNGQRQTMRIVKQE